MLRCTGAQSLLSSYALTSCPVLRRSNYRTLILGLTYGYCFGVELTIDNNIASYFSDQFGKGIKAAGNFGAIFGLFNILSRPIGAPPPTPPNSIGREPWKLLQPLA